eukprot:Pgem_evm1s20043
MQVIGNLVLFTAVVSAVSIPELEQQQLPQPEEYGYVSGAFYKVCDGVTTFCHRVVNHCTDCCCGSRPTFNEGPPIFFDDYFLENREVDERGYEGDIDDYPRARQHNGRVTLGRLVAVDNGVVEANVNDANEVMPEDVQQPLQQVPEQPRLDGWTNCLAWVGQCAANQRRTYDYQQGCLNANNKALSC